MEIALLLIRLILFAVFAVAGIGKLLDLKGAEEAVKEFGTPAEMAKFFAIALPFAEIVFAVCLLFVETAWTGAIGALILLISFIGAMLWHLAQGTAPDCHCFGAIHSEPVSKKTLIRNIVFAALALFLILSGKENQGASLFDLMSGARENFMTIVLGLAITGLLAAAIFYLKKISEQQTRILRRMEMLELAALGGGETIREGLIEPTNNLPIGAPAPDFDLPDVNGKIISLDALLSRVKPILFFFVSPTCNPCAGLLPEIEAWQAKLKGKLNFVFISSGKAKENLDKLGGATLKTILLQNDRETALAFGAQWTPTAILVNRNGTIASRAAIGDKAIRELLNQIKSKIDDPDILFVDGGDKESRLGKFLPEFSEKDVFGNRVGSEDLKGRRTLVAFWNPACGFCNQMLDDLRDWEQGKNADAPDLLLLSEGEIEAHRNLNLRSPIILDKDRIISKEIGMNGTPSAVLIDENGKIVSETAMGAENIWALIGRRQQ